MAFNDNLSNVGNYQITASKSVENVNDTSYWNFQLS